MILGKIDHITMASNADANKYTQSSLREPDIADNQWEDSVDVYQNDEQFDGKDLDKGVDLGDEIEQKFVKGLNAESQEETCSELKAKQESGTDEDSIYKFLVEDDEGEIKIPLEGNVDKTLESEEPFEEIEEWEEVTEEELSDNEEMEDTEEEDESDDEEGDEEEEGAEDGAEEDMSTKGQSQLGACAYESDEDLEKCYICLAGIRDQDFGTPESCDHTFCLECILEWSKHVNTCPVDRTLFHCILVRYTLGGQIEHTIQVETSNKQEEEQEDSVTYCEVCGCCDREDRLLLCDGCDNGYHCECLDPPLEFIPIEEWYCPECATVELSCQQSVVQQDDEEDNCEDISEEEEKPVTRQQRSVAKENRASQSLRATRAIARTQVSERVMARISEVRAQRQLEQGTVGASSSVFSKKYTPKKSKKKQRKKRKKRVKRKVKGRKVKGKKVKKKVKATRPATVKTRIAGKLGLVKARSGSLLPDRKAHLEPSLDNQRAGIGAAKLNIFGGNDLTEISFDDGQSDNQWASKPNTSQLLPRIKSPSVNTSSSVDLLSSIMQEQKLLHTKSGNVTIHRDGSLSASPAAKESSQQKRRKSSISLEGDYLKPSSGSLTRSPDQFQSSYYIHSTDDTKVKVESHETLEPETDDDWKNVEKKKVDFDNTNEGNQDREMKQLNIREAKGKRAAARELANQRAVEREEEVKNMRERRQEEEEFNDEMVWNIQTPFSVTQKSKDESKIKDPNVNGTKNIEEESKWEESKWEEAKWEEATWEEATWEEEKWEEAVQKKEEEHIKEDNHEKTAPIEHDGKEQGEGTLTCRASTSSFESHSETEERDMRKSVDDKRRRGTRHGKRKRSHLSNTSGSGPDSSAEEGEVKSDDDSKGRKISKKKTKKSKHNRDRDTRNVVVNDHQPISDLPKIPKLKHDSRRVEDRERYERGSGYNDLRHVIQVKRSYENPRYEMYWDEYSRRWVEYRPDWTAAWEQHRTYEQQLYAADWGRQNSGNSHRYLKERSWENFTVKRERSPIFDRRKSRERSNLDKRDIGWEATTERDRRNRGTRDKDRKESRHDHKQGGHTTTRSNSSGTDSQRRERSQDKSRDKDHKEKSKNDNQSNEKNFVRSSRTNGRDKHGRFNETSEKQKSDHHGNKSKERKSRDSVKSEKTATGGKIIEKNDRLKTSAENRKAEEKGKERTKENIDLIAKSTKTDSLEKKKKKKEKQVKVKGKKEKKEKEKKVKKKKDEVIILPDVKETLRMEKEEDLEKKPIIDKPRTNDTSEKHEESSMKAKIDAPCKNTDVKSGPAEIKDVVSSLKNIIKKSNDRTSNSQRISTHTTELDKRTKEPMRAFQETVKVDEPYDPFEPTASPSISNSSPCSPFQALSPPPSSKRKLSSDLDSLNNSTDSAFGGLKHQKIETVKPLPDVKTSKPLTKPFNDILPQLATQDGSKLNQLIDKFVNKSGKATLDSKETDAEKALPGSSKFATSAKKSIIFNAPSPNESDSEFDFNNDDEEIESSAVELQNKNSRERYLKKLHHQERVVEEVKLAIKPYYQRKEIDKHDYKEILKRSVNQVCHSKSGEINPVKIRRLIDGYVKKFQLKKKHVEKGGKEKKKPSSLAELKKKR